MSDPGTVQVLDHTGRADWDYYLRLYLTNCWNGNRPFGLVLLRSGTSTQCSSHMLDGLTPSALVSRPARTHARATPCRPLLLSASMPTDCPFGACSMLDWGPSKLSPGSCR